MRPGGLAEGRIWLPKTIRDALEVTRGLNVRYLWVDIVCVVQDDEADRREQICQMDMIYGHAAVTIVAASKYLMPKLQAPTLYPLSEF
ncbi:tol protein [Colletotrichum musicola]|uniref:Tol protein n=1 Tax=Colletotrichum musicola TaxID=2175873 RepID=A0A8H6J1P6_9PEZI|nr:tol protein [Colletotrichum musicola]